MSDPHEITRLLDAAGRGDEHAGERLFDEVYAELRCIAGRHMRREREGHTLQATALVNEVYVKLAGDASGASDRVHFFALASRAMRRVLVDHARAKGREKRGGGLVEVTLDEAAQVSPESGAALLELDDALERLAAFDSRAARAVELMFFGGLSYEETAETLGVSRTTAYEDVRIAKAWLARAMGGSG